MIDRDGFVVCTLAPKSGVAGDNAFVWDGRDDRREIVPDEAYSFHVTADGGMDEYFPAARATGMVTIEPLSYSRTTATLTYILPTPSRVHVQAGTVRTTAGEQSTEGPVLKTIVDRQPRGGGRVAEHWSGLDESGSLYVPDLPGFAVAIAATPLPENSVITFGNAKRSFLEYAAKRPGQSLFPHRQHGAHHAGLDAFNDLAPKLTLTSVPSAADTVLRLQLRAEGPTADAFVRQPGKIFVFVDSNLVATRDAKQGCEPLDIMVGDHRQHVVAVNWRSDYGPVAVAVARVRVERQTSLSGSRP